MSLPKQSCHWNGEEKVITKKWRVKKSTDREAEKLGLADFAK